MCRTVSKVRVSGLWIILHTGLVIALPHWPGWGLPIFPQLPSGEEMAHSLGREKTALGTVWAVLQIPALWILSSKSAWKKKNHSSIVLTACLPWHLIRHSMPLAVYSVLALHETIVLIQIPSFRIKHEETVTKTLDHCIREPCSFLWKSPKSTCQSS